MVLSVMLFIFVSTRVSVSSSSALVASSSRITGVSVSNARAIDIR